MTEEVKKLWPELEWIKDEDLRAKTARVWELALERSPLPVKDLMEIPFTLKAKDCTVTFMEHKRAVVHISKLSADAMMENMSCKLPIDIDTVVSGAILCDVGKLLEYETVDGESVVSSYGRHVRHPFSGVGLAMECGLPEEVQHIIAAHANEGDLVRRTTEAYIVHYADWMSFKPFMS